MEKSRFHLSFLCKAMKFSGRLMHVSPEGNAQAKVFDAHQVSKRRANLQLITFDRCCAKKPDAHFKDLLVVEPATFVFLSVLLELPKVKCLFHG